MAITLTFTCIPLGVRNHRALFDILISPVIDAASDLAVLATWPQRLAQHPDQLSLASIGPLTLDLTALTPSLWNKLFDVSTTPVFRSNPAAPNPNGVRINPYGVSLSMSRDQLQQFHRSWLRRRSNVANAASETRPLVELHNDAIAQHGFFEPLTPGGPKPSQQQQQQQQQPGPEDPAVAIVQSRLGLDIGGSVQNPTVPSRPMFRARSTTQTSQDVILPVTANANLAVKQLLINVLTGIQVASTPSVSAPRQQGVPKHLLYHYDRNSAGFSAANRARMAKFYADKKDPIDFHQQFSLLLSMPAILEALGLVLHGSFPDTALPPVGANPFALQLQLGSDLATAFPGGTFATTVTQLPQFLPASQNTVLNSSGYLNPGSPGSLRYDVGCQQLESGATQTIAFANHSAQRQTAAVLRTANTSTPGLYQSFDEDIDHPVLPPSPVTGGLQVWQPDKQFDTAAAVNRADTLRAAGMQNLYAEDLINATIADVFPVKNASDMQHPLNLCLRDEVYDIDGDKLQRLKVERGVRTAGIRRLDGASVPQAYEVDETVFNWRLQSLVAPATKPLDQSKPGSIKSGTSSTEQIPWSEKTKFKKTITGHPGAVTPLFGQWYMTSLRPVFITGGTVPFDATAAQNARIGDAFRYQRYELIQGPVAIPVAVVPGYQKKHETSSLMLVATERKSGQSKSVTEYAQRVLAPASVKTEVGRRHGIGEDVLEHGTKVLPLQNGALPPYLPDPDWSDGDVAYLPDPLCSGVIAVLSRLDGTVIGTAEMNYYDERPWPDYTRHVIEIRRGGGSDAIIDPATSLGKTVIPIFTRGSQKIVCHIPEGRTFILTLQPKLRPDVFDLHALAALLPTSSGQPFPSGDLATQLAAASTSDVCRPTYLRLTHATDVPIAPATLSLPSTFDRAPGKLFSFTGTADAQSTAVVEVMADWLDQSDNQEQPGPVLQACHAKLIEIQVHKRPGTGITAFPFSASDVRLPFSDARYRRVFITPRSSSRFREVFAGDDLLLNGAATPVDFRSTAPPKAPDIEVVLPNFKWNWDTPHQRTFLQGITLVHNRSWFSSGNGEQLAVLTSKAKQGVADSGDTIAAVFDQADDEAQVSAWGALLDWVPASPNLADFANIQLLPGDNVYPADLDAKGSPLDAKGIVNVGGTDYHAMFYTPQYNAADAQWYFNLTFHSGPLAYGAVIRLLVARRQQNCASGDLALSPVLPCDFAPLWPDRMITITRQGWFFHKTATVEIKGVGPASRGACTAEDAPSMSIEVRRAKRGGEPKNGFTWAESQPWPSDANLPAGTLWRATMPLPLGEDHVLIVRELNHFIDAEKPVGAKKDDATRSCTVFLDAFKI